MALLRKFIFEASVSCGQSERGRFQIRREIRLLQVCTGHMLQVVCCSVLWCVAGCCRVLPCAIVCCSVLQCVAACCSVLQRVAVCCSVLQCVVVCCSVLPCVAVCCGVLAIWIHLFRPHVPLPSTFSLSLPFCCRSQSFSRAHAHTLSITLSCAHAHTYKKHTQIHTRIRSSNHSLPHKRPESTRGRQSGGAPQTEPAISAPTYTQIYKYHAVSTYTPRVSHTYTPRVSHTHLECHIHTHLECHPVAY